MSLKEFVPAIKYGNLVDNLDINSALAQSVTVTLTSAQILALNTTPVTLITTTASGQLIVPQSCVFEMNPTTTTYTSGGVVNIGYNGSTTNIMAATFPAGLVTTGAAGYTQVEAANGPTTLTPNVGISITNSTGNFTTGTGTAKVFLNYYIVNI